MSYVVFSRNLYAVNAVPATPILPIVLPPFVLSWPLNMLLCLLLVAVAWTAVVGVTEDVEDGFMRIIRQYNTERNSTAGQHVLKQAHLIRVPKASSSSLSAIARRMVGCDPPGPCCRYPGNPPGSCPVPKHKPDLLFQCQTQKRVIGCTHHHPNLPVLNDPSVVSFSMMREPIARALSAFSYVPPHSNRKGPCKEGYTPACFKQYVNGSMWNNIVVKMMSGSFSYVPAMACERGCANNLATAQVNLAKLTFMGITELWPVSILVLYARVPSLAPMKAEFSPYALGDAITSGTRQNIDPGYTSFKRTARDTYAHALANQNSLDIVLYRQALMKLCIDLHELGLWAHTAVQLSWSRGLPPGYEDVAPACVAADPHS